MTQQQRTLKTAAVVAVAAAAAAAVAVLAVVVVVVLILVRSRDALSHHSGIAATSFCRAYSEMCLRHTACVPLVPLH
jgi:hypothetical protein